MRRKVRNSSGASTLVIVLITAFMIILPLGLLGYEFLRFSLVQQQLRSVCDAAALAGAVGIATNGGGSISGTTVTLGLNSLWIQDRNAMAGAYDAFCNNSVTDCQFNSVDQTNSNVNVGQPSSTDQPSYFNVSTPHNNVPPHTAQVNFVLVDTSGNQTNWSPGGSPNQPGLISASSIRVDAYYGYSLPLLGGMNIGPFTMNASSTGGLPQLDVILCFDMSGSMDDFTNVTFVNRYWVDTRAPANTLNGATLTQFETAAGLPVGTWTGGCVEYDIPPSPASYGGDPLNSPPFWASGSDGSASGPLYYVLGCNTNPNSENGTALNVQPPMNLNEGPFAPNQMWFMANERASGAGKPPGNYSGTPQPFANSSPAPVQDSKGFWKVFLEPCYTDLVVNLNTGAGTQGGNDSHWPFGTPATAGSFSFPDVAWAVEGARGNLEAGTGAGSPLQLAVNPLQGTASDNNNFYIIKDAQGNIHVSSFTGASSGGGYQASYWNFVQQNTHPLSDAIKAANSFFTFLYQSSDCHFGLICFSDGIGSQTAGTPPSDTWADGWESPPGSTHLNGWTTAAVGGGGTPPQSANIAGKYTGGSSMSTPPLPNADPDGPDLAGGDGAFLLPLCSLNNGLAYSTASTYDNYTNGAKVNDFMQLGNGKPNGAGGGSIVATGSTDITDALAEAVRELTPANGFTRPNATRAIVLFTDGSPDIDANAMPPSPSFSTCDSDCQAQATAAHSVSPPIPIYSIGLAMDNSMVGRQGVLLGDITSAANGGSPNGPSIYKQIQNAGQIQTAFESIAKNLVVITK